MEEEKKTVEDGEKNDLADALDNMLDSLKEKASRAKKRDVFGKQMGLVLTLYGNVLTHDTLLRGVLEFLNSALAEALKASQAIVDEMKEKGETGWN